MTLIEQIAEILAAHEVEVSFSHESVGCKCRQWDDETNTEPHSEHVAPLVLALFTERWSDDVAGPGWARYQHWVSETVVHHGPNYASKDIDMAGLRIQMIGAHPHAEEYGALVSAEGAAALGRARTVSGTGRLVQLENCAHGNVFCYVFPGEFRTVCDRR